MPKSDKNIHQSLPISCTTLKNIFELISTTHCSTMQNYTHETKDRSLPPLPHMSPLGYAPSITAPLGLAEFGQINLKFR